MYSQLFPSIFVDPVGGSVGSILGMHTFRHKTKYIKFIVGMPVILAAHIVIAILILT